MTDAEPRRPSSFAYIQSLDGMRGFLMLWFLAYHAGLPHIRGVFISLDSFFALSGFLITTLLLREHLRVGRINLKHFYMRRVLRLAPALLLMLLVVCAASFLFLPSVRAYATLKEAGFALAYFSNWARAFEIDRMASLGHTWSLSVEEQFYAVWPLAMVGLLRWCKNTFQVALVAFGIAFAGALWRFYMSAQGASIERMYNGTDCRLDALMAGCALALFFASHKATPQLLAVLRKMVAVVLPFSLALMLVYWHLGDWQHAFMYQFGFFINALFSSLVMTDLILRPNGWLSRFLSARFLVWTGSIAYGIYLWHFPIFETLFEHGWQNWGVLLVGTAITVAVAATSFYMLERPALRLKRHFSGG